MQVNQFNIVNHFQQFFEHSKEMTTQKVILMTGTAFACLISSCMVCHEKHALGLPELLLPEEFASKLRS